VIPGPVGKAAYVNGEDDPYGMKRFYAKIEKGIVKQELNPILPTWKILICWYARAICKLASEIPPIPPLQRESVKKFKHERQSPPLLSRGRENLRRQNRRDIPLIQRIHPTSAKERRPTDVHPGKYNRIFLWAEHELRAPRAKKKSLPHFGKRIFPSPGHGLVFPFPGS
jgi:hypothetical protein